MSTPGINERQVALRSGTGKHATLKDWLDRIVCKRINWNDSLQLVITTPIQRIRVADTIIVGTNTLAISTDTIFNGSANSGIVARYAASLSVNNTTVTTDTVGNVLNLCELRDATTHQPILETSGKMIYGLLHSDSTDGDNHSGDESTSNLLMTFVYIASNGTITAVEIENMTVEFRFARAYIAREMDEVTLMDGAVDREVIEADLEGYVQTSDASDTVESETGWGQEANAGISDNYSRADHTHGTQDLPIASDIAFNNSGTGLISVDVQTVIEEIETLIAENNSVEIITDLYAHTGASIDAETALTINTIWSTQPTIPLDYNTNNGWEFFLNGVRLRKGTLASGAEIERIDTTQIRISYTLDEGDVLEYKYTNVS